MCSAHSKFYGMALYSSFFHLCRAAGLYCSILCCFLRTGVNDIINNQGIPLCQQIVCHWSPHVAKSNESYWRLKRYHISHNFNSSFRSETSHISVPDLRWSKVFWLVETLQQYPRSSILAQCVVPTWKQTSLPRYFVVDRPCQKTVVSGRVGGVTRCALINNNEITGTCLELPIKLFCGTKVAGIDHVGGDNSSSKCTS